MAKRLNISLTDDEYKQLTAAYRDFINNYDFEVDTPPSLTGFAAAVIICALRLSESPKGEKI